MEIARPSAGARGDFKRLGQKSIARENGNALAVNPVTGWLPAPVIIIVHGGQVVMDQRIGMNTFDSTGQRHRNRVLSSARRGGCKAKSGSHTLAASEKRIAHGLVNCARARAGGWQITVQRAIYAAGAGGKEFVQVKHRVLY